MDKKVLYPDLSFQIVGILYKVYNELKYGHKEKIYQLAIEQVLKQEKILYKRELYYPIIFNNKKISSYYFDFLVDDKIVLEIKVAKDFYQKDVNQLLSYLKFQNYRLGILALFTKEGIKYRRLLN